MSLRDRLTAQIAAGGPISVAQYMNACLHDPDFGYYATHPAIGEAGATRSCSAVVPLPARASASAPQPSSSRTTAR